ncbi:MAG: phosphatidate cytidylyltransferase [Clostridia bacterium]|nr:phosphatidate cytidylyltransferase [Clostridia bacterium]
MLTRILTAVVGIILFAVVVIAPPIVLYVALLLVGAGLLYEAYRVMDAKWELQIVGFLAEVVMFFFFLTNRIGPAFFGAILLFMAAMVLFWKKSNSKEVLALGMITIFIVSTVLSIVVLRASFNVFAFLLPFIIAWATDTGAYFTGYFFGKHKLAPEMSPKKTVEGAIGGIITAMVVTVAYGLVLYGSLYVPGMIKYAIVGGLGSVVAQIGDLAASCIKRDFDKKDYGALLPGHGGLMDRFDSVLFVAPYVLFMIIYFGI